MTLYNCSICKSVHDSTSPTCTSGTVRTIGIGSMHPDLQALIEFKEAVLAWMRAEGVKSTYDRMVELARRWEP